MACHGHLCAKEGAADAGREALQLFRKAMRVYRKIAQVGTTWMENMMVNMMIKHFSYGIPSLVANTDVRAILFGVLHVLDI